VTAGPARVVCIGIATLDAIVEVERLPGHDERTPATDSALAGGGVAATAAVALARLGVATALIARVGADRSGRWIRDDLEAEGVETSGIRLDPGCRSPLSVVLVERPTGARAIVPDVRVAATIELSDDDLRICRAAEWIHLDQVGASVLPTLREAGVTARISVDDGVGIRGLDLADVTLYAPTVEILRARFPAATLDESLRAALAAGPRIAVATRGAEGAVALERTDHPPETRSDVAPGWPAAVRSTLGAGDVFHGALLAGLVDGRALAEALDRASACAALSCEALDGRSGIPDVARLEQFMRVSRRDRDGGAGRGAGD
jgi:sulfofructose kinase